MREVWIAGPARPDRVASDAVFAEESGFDGLTAGDNQCRNGDVFITLALAAEATSRLKLGTGVTIPLTRHPAVVASAIGTIQQVSRGRAVLGIGRGDSALAYLGVGPAPLGTFERFLSALQAYLAGDDVPFEEARFWAQSGGHELPDLTATGLGHGRAASRIKWLPGRWDKVPVDVSATGPLAIAAGVRLADRVTLSVGADPDRVRWAIATAHEACASLGRSQETISLGAFLAVGLHDDPQTARGMIGGMVATTARYAVMHGTPTGPITPDAEVVLAEIRSAYEMAHHAANQAAQTSVLTPEFIDGYALVGGPEACLERMHELFELGLDRLHLTFGSADEDPSVMRARDRFASDVLPHLRS